MERGGSGGFGDRGGGPPQPQQFDRRDGPGRGGGGGRPGDDRRDGPGGRGGERQPPPEAPRVMGRGAMGGGADAGGMLRPGGSTGAGAGGAGGKPVSPATSVAVPRPMVGGFPAPVPAPRADGAAAAPAAAASSRKPGPAPSYNPTMSDDDYEAARKNTLDYYMNDKDVSVALATMSEWGGFHQRVPEFVVYFLNSSFERKAAQMDWAVAAKLFRAMPSAGLRLSSLSDSSPICAPGTRNHRNL